jgi:hypothetical protein
VGIPHGPPLTSTRGTQPQRQNLNQKPNPGRALSVHWDGLTRAFPGKILETFIVVEDLQAYSVLFFHDNSGEWLFWDNSKKVSRG